MNLLITLSAKADLVITIHQVPFGGTGFLEINAIKRVLFHHIRPH
jgi:hypothetical protein